MRRVSILGIACLGLSLGASGCNDATDGVTVFRATLSGANEVPPVATAASGSCGFQAEAGLVRYAIEVHGLTGVRGAHIHAGAAGQNGSIRVNLYPNTATTFAATPTGDVNGTLIEGRFTAADVRGASLDQLLNEMRAGAVYCNVHTVAFGGGEIRGQIQPQSLD